MYHVESRVFIKNSFNKTSLLTFGNEMWGEYTQTHTFFKKKYLSMRKRDLKGPGHHTGTEAAGAPTQGLTFTGSTFYLLNHFLGCRIPIFTSGTNLTYAP